MVQFLKSKGASFINKPVGVNNVNTGAVESSQTLAKVSQNLTAQFLADAEQEQIKLGKEVGMTLPVRDEDGNLSFQTTPTTLSDVAKNAAEPIIQKRYEDALNVDLFAKINEIRQKSRTSGEFSKNVENEMSVYIEQTKQSGGERYVGSMTETIAKLSSQHFNAMATEETKEAMRLASIQLDTLNNRNIADLQEFAANEIDKADILDLNQVILGLKDNVDAVIENNNLNLSVNNLALDTHKKTDTRAKTAISYALVDIITKNKTPAQILDLENYFRTGVVPQFLSDKEKVILKNIKEGPTSEGPFRDEVKKYLSSVQDKVKETQATERADKNYERVQNELKIKEYRDDPVIYRKSQDYKSSQIQKVQSIYKDVFNNGGVITDEQKADIRKFEDNLFKATVDKGILVNGQRIILGKAEASAAINDAVILGLENTIVESQLFKTANDLSLLQNALYQRDPSLLNTEQKKVYDTVISVSSASLQQESIINATGKTINDNITSANRKDAIEIETISRNNTINNAKGIGQQRFGNTRKEQEVVSEHYGVDPMYFLNEFAEETKDNLSRAIELNKQMSLGNFSSSFLDFMDNALTARTEQEIARALNYFAKYTKVEEGGLRVDKLYDVMDKETYAKYSIAAKLMPAFRGKKTFFDVEGVNGGPVTQVQIMQKINQVYQTRKKPESITGFKSNLESIIGTEKNAMDYLINQMKFDRVEARDLQFVVEMAASLGLSKSVTDSILKISRNGIYLDGESTVIDFFSGTDDAFRTKYSFKAVFGAEEDGFARSVVQSKLNQLEHFHEKIDEKTGEIVKRPVGSYKLMFAPKQVIDGEVQYSTGTKTDVEVIKPDVNDTPVYLQPIPYGSRKEDVRYVAVRKKGDLYRPLKLPNGALLAFDAKELRRGGTTAEVGGIE